MKAWLPTNDIQTPILLFFPKKSKNIKKGSAIFIKRKLNFIVGYTVITITIAFQSREVLNFPLRFLDFS